MTLEGVIFILIFLRAMLSFMIYFKCYFLECLSLNIKNSQKLLNHTQRKEL